MWLLIRILSCYCTDNVYSRLFFYLLPATGIMLPMKPFSPVSVPYRRHMGGMMLKWNVSEVMHRERRNTMWPFDASQQQMYQNYANAWDQGTYNQLPAGEVQQNYQRLVQNAPAPFVQQVHQQ